MMAKVRRVSMAAAMVGSAFTAVNLTGIRRGSARGAPPSFNEASGGSAPDRIVAFGELLHDLAILLDRLADLGGALAREGARVGHRAADADVVAHDVGAIGIGLHIVQIDLL